MPSTKRAGAVAADRNANNDSEVAERALREYLQSLYPPPRAPREPQDQRQSSHGAGASTPPISSTSSAL
jgi:hypothetical protein